MTQQEMLLKLQQYSFALWDTHLFLDTHPYDTQALAYYRKLEEEYEQLRAEYMSMYPLLSPTAENSQYWRWIAGPWPWHLYDYNSEG